MRLTSFTTPTLFKSDIIMMIFPTNSALRNFHKHKGSNMLQFLSYFDLKKNTNSMIENMILYII